MKKKNVITILLAVALILTCTTVFVLADGNHVTREEFFNSIAKALELKPSDLALEFEDASEIDPEYKENIAAGVESGYFFGRNNGLLDPKTEITIEEIDWVLSRINFKPKTKYLTTTKTVTNTEYVEVPVEKIVEKEVEKIIEKEVEKEVEKIIAKPGCGEDSHYYALDVTGKYICACETNEVPVGTKELVSYSYSVNREDGEEILNAITVNSFGDADIYAWQIQAGNGWMVCELGDVYPIACDAKCFGPDGESMTYAEFMKTYDSGLEDSKWYNVKLLTAAYDWADKYDENYSGDKIVYAIQIDSEATFEE